jgi:hypothetical protein
MAKGPKCTGRAPGVSNLYLGIRVVAMDFPLEVASPVKFPGLTQIVKGLKRKKVVKRIYLPLRGVPENFETLDIAGNHFRALLGKGHMPTDSSSALVLDEGEFHELGTNEVIDNLGRSLLVELGFFIHNIGRLQK